jgi:error-prone DNA polymerase
MGFYSSAQIVRDVREHGVEVRGPDINHSDWDSTLEPGPHAAEHLHKLHCVMRGDIRTTHALRLGLREIKGISEADATLIMAQRNVSYDSVRDVWLRTGLSTRVLERLADADAFHSLGLTRREALWAAKALGRVGDSNDDLPLFEISTGGASSLTAHEPDVALPPMPLGEEVVNDYRFLRLSLRAHPAQFLRADLTARGIIRNEALSTMRSGARARISGLVTCRQKPGSAKGVVFMTIEDETAVANVIVWPKFFERVRPVVLGARYVAVSGRMQSEAGVIHVVADELEDLTHWLAQLAEQGADIEGLARADEVRRPIEDHREARAMGARHGKLMQLMREMPELTGDLDVTARGSAHAPTRKARSG